MLRYFQNMRIRNKILTVVGIQAVLLSGAFLAMFVYQVNDSAWEDTVSQARRVVSMAESIRTEMSKKWKQGIFEQKLLAQWAENDETDKVLSSVPIVTAWEAVMARAEEGGYKFRTPKFDPRNPGNTPDELEAEALNAFKASPELSEYTIYDQASNAIRYFSPIRLEQECMICHGDPARSQELWANSDGLDPTGHRMEGYSEGDLHGAFEVVQSLDAADQRASSAIVGGLGLTALVLIPSLLALAFFVKRSIAGPIDRTVETLKDIANGDGDLTSRLSAAGDDEVGQLSHWFNTFVARIEGVVREITSGSTTLNEASDAVLKNASGVSSDTQRSREESGAASQAADEMSANMRAVADDTSRMSSKLSSVSDSVNGMQEMISRIAGNADQSASFADEAETVVRASHQQIGDMGDAANQIGAIVSVIQDIAEQTNLLALNATIEASRAGDAGKGFAVVAAEVKALAKQTAEATDDIRSQVANVQQQTKVAVSSMDAIDEVIAKVNELNRQIAGSVDEQHQTATVITADVAAVAELAESVAGQVRETSEKSQDMNNNLTQVDEILADTASGAVESLAAGEKLREVASQMQGLVSQFKVGSQGDAERDEELIEA